jgi:hypothetical protein
VRAYPARLATVVALRGSLHSAGFAALDRVVIEALDDEPRANP